MAILYLLAPIALLMSTAAIYMALIKPFPVQWLYYHSFVRKPVVWAIFGGSLLWAVWQAEMSFRIRSLSWSHKGYGYVLAVRSSQLSRPMREQMSRRARRCT